MNVRIATAAPPKAAPQTLNLTGALAERNAAWHFLALPGDARELVRQCLLDWIAVTLAGAHEPLACMLAEEAREQAATRSPPSSGRASPPAAARPRWSTAPRTHALDYDDVNMSFTGHPERGARAAAARTRRGARRQRSGVHDGVRRRLRDPLPHRRGGVARALRVRLPRHRDDRQPWRGGRLRAAAAARPGRHRGGAGHRRHRGRRPEVDVRHDVQAAACRTRRRRRA